jgi:hypothetical protein
MLPRARGAEPEIDAEPVTRTRPRSTYARELSRWFGREENAARTGTREARPRTGTDDAWAEEAPSVRIPFLIF